VDRAIRGNLDQARFLAAFGDSSEEIYYMQRTPTTSERRSAALTWEPRTPRSWGHMPGRWC